MSLNFIKAWSCPHQLLPVNHCGGEQYLSVVQCCIDITLMREAHCWYECLTGLVQSNKDQPSIIYVMIEINRCALKKKNKDNSSHSHGSLYFWQIASCYADLISWTIFLHKWFLSPSPNFFREWQLIKKITLPSLFWLNNSCSYPWGLQCAKFRRRLVGLLQQLLKNGGETSMC